MKRLKANVTSAIFLRLNGYLFTTSPTDGLRFMEGIATDEVTELQFASWLEAVVKNYSEVRGRGRLSGGKSPCSSRSQVIEFEKLQVQNIFYKCSLNLTTEFQYG